MRAKYKRYLTFIGILLLFCITIGIAYLFYDKVLNDSTLVVVEDELSINYINGNEITKDGKFVFSVTNNGSKDIYYDIMIDNLVGFNPNLTYTITSSDSEVNIEKSVLKKDENTLVSNVLIAQSDTQNFTLVIDNLAQSRFNLKIKKMNNLEEYFSGAILKNNKVVKKTLTKPSLDIATTSEGLIEDVDDYGLTYYFRGKVENNYVKFADKDWRIVRINGDGTVKLILDEPTTELSNYSADMNSYEDLSKSSINDALNAFYEANLKEYDLYIAGSKYCIEKEKTELAADKIYNAYTRLITNKIPAFTCLGTSYSSKIGLLSADEVALAGANFKDNNKDYYLYNEKIEGLWWTSSLAKAQSTVFYPFAVDSNGKLVYDVNGTLYRSLRPTISLTKKITVSGDGTKTNPYTINP